MLISITHDDDGESLVFYWPLVFNVFFFVTVIVIFSVFKSLIFFSHIGLAKRYNNFMFFRAHFSDNAYCFLLKLVMFSVYPQLF